jgi:predicted Zn-dependent protease
VNLRAAREILLEYIKDNPTYPLAWYLLAQASEDDTLAIAALKRALKLDPDYEDASILLAGIKRDAEMITYPIPPEDDNETNQDESHGN